MINTLVFRGRHWDSNGNHYLSTTQVSGCVHVSGRYLSDRLAQKQVGHPPLHLQTDKLTSAEPCTNTSCVPQRVFVRTLGGGRGLSRSFNRKLRRSRRWLIRKDWTLKQTHTHAHKISVCSTQYNQVWLFSGSEFTQPVWPQKLDTLSLSHTPRLQFVCFFKQGRLSVTSCYFITRLWSFSSHHGP